MMPMVYRGNLRWKGSIVAECILWFWICMFLWPMVLIMWITHLCETSECGRVQRDVSTNMISGSSDSNPTPVADIVHKQLPVINVTTRMSKPMYVLDADSACSICLAHINYNNWTHFLDLASPEYDDPCVTTCHHVSHYGCLEKWLTVSSTCPTCRQLQHIGQVKVSPADCRRKRIDGDVETITSRVYGYM